MGIFVYFKRRKVFWVEVLIGVGLSLIASANGQCQHVGWATEEPTCPSGFKEMFMEIHPTARQYIKYCCNLPPERFEKIKKNEQGCKVTKCKSYPGSDVCTAGMNERYYDGKRFEYDEIARDTCNLADGGGTGEVAYCCPKDSLENALVATLAAENYEFPHQVKLDLNGGQCGGTIYNKRFIVTAAHCIVGKEDRLLKDPKTMRAFIGTNLAGVEDGDVVYKVKKAIPHEKYSKMKGHKELEQDHPQTYHDMAVLELDRDIKFSDRVKALEIAPKGFDPFKYADHTVIVGWGTTQTGLVSKHLQKANFILRSDHTCFEFKQGAPWAWQFNRTESLLCVGGIRDGKWSPTAGGGDSGGPAICRGADGKIVLCGVTSYGGSDEKCLENNDEASCPPSVYAEVSHYHDWIKSKAGEQDPKTFYKPYLYGEPVPKGKYDHQVHVTSKTGKSCGGTLIAPDMVITAARCIMKTDGSGSTHSGLKVHYGLRDVTGGSGKTFGIKGAIGLPDFPKEAEAEPDVAMQGNHVIMTDNYLKDDLAIVKLDGKAPITPNKIPTLPTFDDSFSQATEVAFPRNTTLGGELRSRDYKLIEMDRCQRRMNLLSKYDLDVKVDQNLICGVEKYSGGSLCDRELGGGLICKKGGKDVLCGVQVFRLCTSNIPNGFMNMVLYGDWAKQAMDALRKQ